MGEFGKGRAAWRADEPCHVASQVVQEPRNGGIWKMAELATTTGYRVLSGLLDAPPAERAPFYQLLLTSTAGWARAMRKISESRAGPQSQTRKACRSDEVDIVAKINTNPTNNGLGESLCPRQDAARLSAAAFREGRDADPQNIPLLAAKRSEAPWATEVDTETEWMESHFPRRCAASATLSQSRHYFGRGCHRLGHIRRRGRDADQSSPYFGV